MLAVRLYSGPAFQPINTFLRQIAGLSGVYRAELAQNPKLTFAATVGHLCRAIRKLAAVATPEEAEMPLWRGVRGELDRAFWVPDSQGMVTAVDMAFMSTSIHRETPIQYLRGAEEQNVLWELKPQVETDAGFHRGASIELLSQFASEGEILFPPCTMLRVQERLHEKPLKGDGLLRQMSAAASKIARQVSETSMAQAAYRANYQATQKTEGGKQFLSISVLPTFL